MDAVALLGQAKNAGLTVIADADRLVVRGPRSAAPIVEQLRYHKPEVLIALRREQEKRDAETDALLPDHFVPWVLEEWRRVSIPQWRNILRESITQGDKRRQEYAHWMLREVLQDSEPQDAS